MLALFFGGPALADSSSGVGALATPLDVLEAVPMDGPYASLADLCRAEKVEPAVCEATPRDCGPAGQKAPQLKPPFIEARVIQWRNACEFVLRTDAGWWQRPPDRSPAFLHNGERYMSELDHIDSTVDGALVIRASFVHWTCPDKMAWLKHPRFDEWYECEQRVLVCAVGTSNTPSCTAPVASGYTTYCRASEPPYSRLRYPVAGVDFQWATQVTRKEMRLTGTSRPVDGPLPGWYVVAADAKRRRDERRALPPPRLKLHFP
jgi:hypothetical protein